MGTSKCNEVTKKVITDWLIEQVEKAIDEGRTLNWVKAWASMKPCNYITRNPYRGVNAFVTSIAGSQWYITKKQVDGLCIQALSKDKDVVAYANEHSKETACHGNEPLGLIPACIRMGKELPIRIKKDRLGNGIPIVFYNFVEVSKTSKDADSEDEETRKIPFMTYYRVFRLEDVEGLTPPASESDTPIAPMQAPQSLVDMAISKMGLKTAIGDCAYSPSLDTVYMPPASSFGSNADEYYSSYFHELTHATGIPSRLNRFKSDHEVFSSMSERAVEELVAELGSAILSEKSGVASEFVKINSAAYLLGWLKRLKTNRNMLFESVPKASKAVEYILGDMQPKEEKA